MTTKAYSYIRFSTPEQLKGDSLRRQREKSQAYAAEHGLELDTTLNMRDLGVSAFRGANIEKGNLGVFIKAIEQGLIEPGSYLLVESLDRLSRAEVIDSLSVFLQILSYEIIIVTLVDKREYSRESVRANYSELIVSIAVMARSHDESLTKSVRRKDTWDQRKKLFADTGKKLTLKTPFWLTLASPDVSISVQ
jgi:DNA invertase Pin-like site-specific DNA recombinase